MIPLTDNDLMPFGKFKGDKMQDVPGVYLDWLAGQDWIDKWPAVVEYIERNRAVIDKELKSAGIIW